MQYAIKKTFLIRKIRILDFWLHSLLHFSKLIAQKFARNEINCALGKNVLTVNTARRYTAVFNKPNVYNTVTFDTAIFFQMPVNRASLVMTSSRLFGFCHPQKYGVSYIVTRKNVNLTSSLSSSSSSTNWLRWRKVNSDCQDTVRYKKNSDASHSRRCRC